MEYKYKLEKDQQERLDAWKEKIKEKHGQYGYYDYIFTPYGMGLGVKVYSHLEKEAIDLSDVQDW